MAAITTILLYPPIRKHRNNRVELAQQRFGNARPHTIKVFLKIGTAKPMKISNNRHFSQIHLNITMKVHFHFIVESVINNKNRIKIIESK